MALKLNQLKTIRASNPHLDISPLDGDFSSNRFSYEDEKNCYSTCLQASNKTSVDEYNRNSQGSQGSSGILADYRTSSDASEASSRGSVLSDTIIEDDSAFDTVKGEEKQDSGTLKLDNSGCDTLNHDNSEIGTPTHDSSESGTLEFDAENTTPVDPEKEKGSKE